MEIKPFFVLDFDYSNFERTCHLANEILTKHNYFLQIFELRDKFRYLTHDTFVQKSIKRKVSSCILEKFNGFDVVRIENERSTRKKFQPIDIIYKPVRKITQTIECFFSTQIYLAFRTTFNEGDRIRHGGARQCNYCSNFYGKKDKYNRHIEHCLGQLGIIYDFNLQNLVTFEDNLKYKGEIPVTYYVGFETIAPTDDYLDPKNQKMFAVSYAIIFAFHPDLNFERVLIERSFGHNLAELVSINYLTCDQMTFINTKTLMQLKDAAFQVSSRKNKQAISTMFNIEIKFAADILLKWFNMKDKPKNLELDPFIRIKYQTENPIDWETTKCFICSFPLNITPRGLNYTECDISYIDFVIRKEHAFLRDIYDAEDLKKSKNIKDIESCYSDFEHYLKIIKYMEDEIKNVSIYEMIYNDDAKEFLEEECPAWSDDIENLISDIKAVEMKNFKSKTPKFSLQIYGFVYDILMDFPENKFTFQTVTTSGVFENLYRILNFKVRVHHSHVSGKMFWYVHDFCNWKVRENQMGFSLIGHNFLNFDFFYMLKGYRSACWGGRGSTNDVSIGRANLSTISFANIGSQMKIIDTIKYYQSSLA